MNSKTPKSEDRWLPCDEGAIVDAVSSIENRENQKSRRQFLRGVMTASVIVAGVGFTGWTLFDQKDELLRFGQGQDQLRDLRNNPNYPGGIACSEVQRLMAQYIGNSLNDVALHDSIEVHLTKCGHCCEIHDSMTQSSEVA